MNHQQWLEWRRSGIGSSDAAVIMNVSPWKTAFQLWEEKVFGKSDQEENTAMTRGKQLEEVARQLFERELNTVVFPKNVVHTQHSWLRASLDGMDIDEKIMVEIKCPNKDDHFLAVTKKVPTKYFPQCQHQLAVTGLPGMFYFSFDGSKGAIVEVARDQKYIDDMLEKEKIFWNMVINQIPPELTDKDSICMKEVVEWEKKAQFLASINDQIKALEKEALTAKEYLISLSQGKSAYGSKLTLKKSVCRGSIDYNKAIAEYLENMRSHYPDVDFPDIPIEPFRKSSFIKWTLGSIS
jgi:putative phage-type endonuclease